MNAGDSVTTRQVEESSLLAIQITGRRFKKLAPTPWCVIRLFEFAFKVGQIGDAEPATDCSDVKIDVLAVFIAERSQQKAADFGSRRAA